MLHLQRHRQDVHVNKDTGCFLWSFFFFPFVGVVLFDTSMYFVYSSVKSLIIQCEVISLYETKSARSGMVSALFTFLLPIRAAVL